MLLEQIKQKQARIGVVGLGYVGLPLVIEFGRAGFQVIGLDIDPAKVDRLNRGESYIKHIPSKTIREPEMSFIVATAREISLLTLKRPDGDPGVHHLSRHHP